MEKQFPKGAVINMYKVQEKKKFVAWIIGNIHFHSQDLGHIFHYILNYDHVLNNVFFINDEEFNIYNKLNRVLQFKVTHDFEEIDQTIQYSHAKDGKKHTSSNLEMIQNAIRFNSSTSLAIYIQQEDADIINYYKALTTIPYEFDTQKELDVKVDSEKLDSFLNQILENGRNRAMYRLIDEALETRDEELFYRVTNQYKAEKSGSVAKLPKI
ncbi:YpiB family protein [Bacillus sp. DHT2]|uniref:YpiB family protein n=1 Tax=Bacillus sp. DHT2 TaxID=2994532 RepID=UPI002248A4F9|nr:YpiB family protein [Bacillus sp. DHT2]MCX2829168.1 YpiB family protein [Bacillus sp. DHT2]